MHVTPAFYVATDAYLDKPKAGNANQGFNLSFKNTGEFVPIELGWHTDGNALPGDYGAQITPWLKLRPNLQYVIHPGGTGSIPDTLVAGLYTKVTF